LLEWRKASSVFYGGMRLRLDLVLLIALTILLVLVLVYVAGPEVLRRAFSSPDNLHPKPVVRISIFCGGGVAIVGDGSMSCPIDEPLDLLVELVNNSSEPSARRDFAAGFLLVLEGGRVARLRLGGFDGAIGIGGGGVLINPINSTMLEVFARYIGPWESRSSEVTVARDPGARCIKISYRGWIVDEDDFVWNPATGERELYIARFPPEDASANPPDSRWAGEEFLRYRMYHVLVCSQAS